jgi:hypothetical protein
MRECSFWRVLVFGAASCVGGWFLGSFVSRSSLWPPEWVWNATQLIVRIAGIARLDNEDDIETLCLSFLWIACSVAVALAIGFAWFVLARYIRKRQSSNV